MPPRLIHTNATLRLRDDGTIRIAVVADTHSEPHAAHAERLKQLAPDAILHAGDIGDIAVLEGLKAFAPLYAVRGNIDNKVRDVPDVMTIDLENAAGEKKLRMLLVHIAVYGPKLRAEIAKLAREQKATLVVCGHSHVPFIGVDRGITLFNPGSIGPKRFQLPIVFGTIDVTPTGVRLQHLSVETGERWLPPM
ncbi:MAG TPA: metallophosphoesterase family protein [Kofleriaceae bacterium]